MSSDPHMGTQSWGSWGRSTKGVRAANCHTKEPLTGSAVPSWALRHESITTLSTGHLCMSYLPWAPSIHYSDGRVSGGEKKSSDLHQSFAALQLGSLTGPCKRKDRQKQSVAQFSWRRQTSSYRSAVILIELTVSSFLPLRSSSLRLPGVKTFHFCNTVSCTIFLWVCCLFGLWDVLSSVGL